MTQCWPEGALRAYLDRELPTEDMQRLAAHLGECTVCNGLCTEMAARAAHVSALMDELPEWSGAVLPRPAAPASAPHRRGTWVGIAVALAAGLALAAYLMPDRHPREAVALPAPVPALAAPPMAQFRDDLDPLVGEFLRGSRAAAAKRGEEVHNVAAGQMETPAQGTDRKSTRL